MGIHLSAPILFFLKTWANVSLSSPPSDSLFKFAFLTKV